MNNREKSRIYPGFTHITENCESLLHKFPGISSKLSECEQQTTQPQKHDVKSNYALTILTKAIDTLLETQQENLKLNLNQSAIMPIGIPEEFIVTQGDDYNPMEIIENHLNTSDGFLGYRVLNIANGTYSCGNADMM